MNKHSLEKSGMVAVDGGEIGYRYYKPHDPEAAKRTPLLMVHGGPGGCSIGMYDAVSELADNRPVIFYDQLGSYMSPADMTPDLMQVERFVEEPKHLMDALGIDKVVMLGHSWGGVVVTDFTLKYPERVEGLILSSALVSTQRWVDDCNALLSAFPEEVQEVIERCQREGTTDSKEYEEADEVFSKRHFVRRDNPPEGFMRNLERTNRDVYKYMWGPSEFSHAGTLGDVDYVPELHNIKVPTLIVTGEYDTATPDFMREVQAEIEGSELFIVPDSGHGTLVDNPEAYIGAVDGFLNSSIETPKLQPNRSAGPQGPHQP